MKTHLLAPYLEQNDLWAHFAQVVQTVCQEPYEKVVRYLSWIRYQYITEDEPDSDHPWQIDWEAVSNGILRSAVGDDAHEAIFEELFDGRMLGDINDSGSITSADSLAVLRYSVGQLDLLTVPQVAYIRGTLAPRLLSDSTKYAAYLVPAPGANTKISDGQMLRQSDFSNWERQLLIRLVNLQGFTFKNSSILETNDYLRMFRELPQYWYGKGMDNFIEFFSFVFNTPFTLRNLWTQDYKTFLPEGDAGIGTPIYDGGSWYPTTHVQLEYDGLKYGSFTTAEVIQFFYYFANYNLVLKLLITESTTELPKIGVCAAWGETRVWVFEAATT